MTDPGTRDKVLWRAGAGLILLFACIPLPAQQTAIGREVAVARHLQDDEEHSLSVADLFSHGKLLFNANFTDQEGAGRPLSKGTGKELTDPSRPLTGNRAFNRISAPDANSCA